MTLQQINTAIGEIIEGLEKKKLYIEDFETDQIEQLKKLLKIKDKEAIIYERTEEKVTCSD